MKKYFVILALALLLVVSGCGKKSNQVTCSKTETEDGVTMKVSMIFDLDANRKVTNASVVYDAGDKKTAETYCSLMKLMEEEENIECKDTKITIKNLDGFEEDETEDSEKLIGQDIDKLIEEAKKDGYSCK